MRKPKTVIILPVIIGFLMTASTIVGQTVSPEETVDSGKASLTVTSIPDSSYVDINGTVSPNVTPLAVDLDPGNYKLEVLRDGFEPLTHALSLMAGQRVSARFILRSSPPPPISPDSVGLSYFPERPLLDIGEAEQLNQTFKRLAETFAIIPMGQGIIASLLLGGDDRQQANILIAAGAVLSGGSLILGKILSNHKRRHIEHTNAEIEETNRMSQAQNLETDRQLKEINEQALQRWEEENKDRGRVIIDRE